LLHHRVNIRMPFPLYKLMTLPYLFLHHSGLVRHLVHLLRLRIHIGIFRQASKVIAADFWGENRFAGFVATQASFGKPWKSPWSRRIRFLGVKKSRVFVPAHLHTSSKTYRGYFLCIWISSYFFLSFVDILILFL
jgi:hypothetical protein